MQVSLAAHDAAVVEVDAGAVASIARALGVLAASHTMREETWSDPTYWNASDSRRDRCQFLAVGNSINFRFWTLRDGKVIPASGSLDGEALRGSMYLWRRLRLAVQRCQLKLTAGFLAELDEQTFRTAFEDDNGDFPFSVGLADRLANLRDLGARLRDNWHGDFERVVDECKGSLDTFATISASFRAFDDPVQKLTMLNAIMLQGSGLIAFDKSPLPAIDYHLVKQAARQGLVRLDKNLRAKLCGGQFLTRPESDALRMGVREALVEVALEAGLSTAILDNLYWMNRRVCADVAPACDSCNLRAGCAKNVDLGLPLEETRYY